MFLFRKFQRSNPSLSSLFFKFEDVSQLQTNKSHAEISTFQNMNTVERVSTGKMGLYKTQYMPQQAAASPRKDRFQKADENENEPHLQNQNFWDNEIESTARKLLDRFNRNEKKLEILNRKYREMSEKLNALESENKTHKTAIGIYQDDLKSKDKQIQKLKNNSVQFD